MKSPKVSIVVATYRRDKSLKNALRSLVNQSYGNLEIIVVDDNATVDWNKKVKRIVGRFQNTYKKTTIKLIINKKNKGSAETRNIGIKKAKGRFITFLDDDDIYLTNKVRNQVDDIQKTGADYSITDLYLYKNDGTLSEKRTRGYIKNLDSNSLIKYHLMYHMTGTDSLMFKKDYLMDIGMFDPIDIGDEYYLMQKAIMRGGKLSYLNKSDIKAFIHTDDTGLSNGSKKIEGENKLFDFKKKFFSKLNKKEIRYIKMRHHAVLAFTYLKMRKIILFFKEALLSFISSPLNSVRLIINRR